MKKKTINSLKTEQTKLGSNPRRMILFLTFPTNFNLRSLREKNVRARDKNKISDWNKHKYQQQKYHHHHQNFQLNRTKKIPKNKTKTQNLL